MQVIEQSVTNISCTPNALRLIERAGRTCYKSEDRITDDSAEMFVKGIIKRGHESVLEHASATFQIITDRGVSHELVRHRIASYSQESTRYVKYDGIKVVLPFEFKTPRWMEVFGSEFPVTINYDSLKLADYLPPRITSWANGCFDAEIAYGAMISFGEKPEVARSVLPTCLATEIVMTANFREWRHFLKLRTAPAAHPQIREVAGMIKEWFITNYPVIVYDI